MRRRVQKSSPLCRTAGPSIAQKKSITVEDKSELNYTLTGSLPDSFVLSGRSDRRVGNYASQADGSGTCET